MKRWWGLRRYGNVQRHLSLGNNSLVFLLLFFFFFPFFLFKPSLLVLCYSLSPFFPPQDTITVLLYLSLLSCVVMILIRCTLLITRYFSRRK